MTLLPQLLCSALWLNYDSPAQHVSVHKSPEYMQRLMAAHSGLISEHGIEETIVFCLKDATIGFDHLIECCALCSLICAKHKTLDLHKAKVRHYGVHFLAEFDEKIDNEYESTAS